jgi:hypothetical protein
MTVTLDFFRISLNTLFLYPFSRLKLICVRTPEFEDRLIARIGIETTGPAAREMQSTVLLVVVWIGTLGGMISSFAV